MRKEIIGHVGVDSGQLLLCDPCYIDSEWREEPFQDIRIFEHTTTGERLQYQVDFENFNNPIAKHCGKDMNTLLESGEWKQLDRPAPENNFSYNSCCHATLSEQGHGQLHYKLGHPGLGVAFSTSGDGLYPVHATYDDNGELLSVTIQFQDVDVADI